MDDQQFPLEEKRQPRRGQDITAQGEEALKGRRGPGSQRELLMDDLDYVRKMINSSSYGNKSIESEESIRKKTKIAIEESIDKEMKQFEKGYQALLAEIELQAHEGIYKYGDEGECVSVEECYIKSDAKSQILDKNRWQKNVDEEDELKIARYTQEVLVAFYDAALQLHSKALYKEEAVHAFHFLCRLTPRVSSFWLGLGLTLEANREYMEAIDAFVRAIAVKNSTFTPFLAMIHCAQQMKNYTKVKEYLEQQKENAVLAEEVKSALEYIEYLEHKEV